VTCATAAVPRLIGPLLLIRLGRSSENLFADVLELTIRNLLDRCELLRAPSGARINSDSLICKARVSRFCVPSVIAHPKTTNRASKNVAGFPVIIAVSAERPET
jgi:hypothetical protein